MYLKICLKNIKLKILLCAMSFLLLCSCAPTSDESVEISTHPTTESLTSDSKNAKTTAPETSMEAFFPLDERLSEETSFTSFDAEKAEPTEGQDDFSDIVELTYEQIMERFDQIAERAFHTEIKNDMEMEEIISCLMDRYIICTHTYVVSSLFDLVVDENGSWITITDQDQNEYHKIQHRYFNTLEEMEDFTKNTCTQSRAELYVSNSSSMDVYIPMFIENEDGIYYCMPSYFICPSPAFYDDYVVEIKKQSETECVFSYNANVDPKRYNQMCEANGEMVWAESDFYHEGKIVLENGKWKVDYVFPAAF